MKPIKWRDLDLSKLALTKPEKNDSGEHVSHIFLTKENEKQDIFIQTSGGLTYNSFTKELKFGLRGRGDFYTKIETIKNRICDILYQNSKHFFKNKVFPENHIYAAIKELIDIDDDNGDAVMKGVGNSIKLYNRLNEEIEKGEAEIYKGSFILHIKELRIVKKSIYVVVEAVACRLEAEKIIFLGETTPDPVPEPENVKETGPEPENVKEAEPEPEELEPEIEEIIQETTKELENLETKDDEEIPDFFV